MGYEFPSVVFNLMSHELLNPIVKLVSSSGSVRQSRTFVGQKMPCDLRLVNMRTMQTKNEEPVKNEVGLILHRIAYEDCSGSNAVEMSEYFKDVCISSENTKFEQLFVDAKTFSLKQTYLTLIEKNNNQVVKSDDLVFDFVEPMQIEAFMVKF